MKKNIFLTVLVLILTCGLVFAKPAKSNMPSVKLDGVNYYLYYSAKSKETGGFINEYYKPNQTYASWDELIGVHHYPTSFYPIEHAKEFRDFVNMVGSMASLEIYDENNSAILYFVMIDNKKLPIIMEFNVFKYEKSPVCGTIALQYAKRYRLNNALEIEKIKHEFVNNSMKYINRVEKLDIPDIVTVEIDKGKYLHPEDELSVTQKATQKVNDNKIKEPKKMSKLTSDKTKFKSQVTEEDIQTFKKADFIIEEDDADIEFTSQVPEEEIQAFKNVNFIQEEFVEIKDELNRPKELSEINEQEKL